MIKRKKDCVLRYTSRDMRLYGYIDDDWANKLFHTLTNEYIENIEKHDLMDVTIPSKGVG